jgi:DNA-binding XRE family transcriptional regulator
VNLRTKRSRLERDSRRGSSHRSFNTSESGIRPVRRWQPRNVALRRTGAGLERGATGDTLLKPPLRVTASTEDRSLQSAQSSAIRPLPAPAPHELGLILKRMRSARQITRAQLAQKLGLAAAYIHEVENGRKRPSRATFAMLAEGLGISLIVTLAILRVVADQSEQPQVHAEQ